MDEMKNLCGIWVKVVFCMFLGATPALSDDGPYLATVSHLTRVHILESNNVTLRPGSIYDNSTYFELLVRFPQPGRL